MTSYKIKFKLMIVLTISLFPYILIAQHTGPSIAFLSDIHLQDVYGDFESKNFNGIYNLGSDKYATIRSMRSQLNSTRLFNENYFAFLQALENIRKEGIRIVVLPGDYTDDGQPMNVIALEKILQRYSQDYGMRFFITTGNHDPVSPFGSIGMKSDFLSEEGKEIGVIGDSTKVSNLYPVYSSQINHWGYSDILSSLHEYGFFPQEEDLFWSHPFEELDYKLYNYKTSLKNSTLKNRSYKDPNSGHLLPDASYVVEPTEGLWLLAIDGNVFNHPESNGSYDSTGWKGSGNGFNVAIRSKSHQLEWIEKVSKEAEKLGKTLISFSHYPLADFNDGSSEAMKSLFGENKFQLSRVPLPETSQAYAEAGIKIHFAGHMHLNDTELFTSGDSLSLLNIQVPSLAAFPAAYKTLEILPSENVLIQTKSINKVNHFDEFFDLYQSEHKYLSTQNNSTIWNRDILLSSDYSDYTLFHLKELIRLRFIPSDWPEDLGINLQNSSLSELISSLKITKTSSSKYFHEKGKVLEDFYLMKNGSDLGMELIPSERLKFYQNFTIPESNSFHENDQNLIAFFHILQKMSLDLPSKNFTIDLRTLEIVRKN
ncbi:metallophosphoesterase [Algoriphagus sp. D3-2-R+10]|uniref:metallophosphoesterase n=1 Tax=Algoriphagus aurantiacus TaxID=3103948 RepID=UPI002B3DA020|nr:metallophosphoesterase [Algoriphagus sp. D3-2-R+10]MEB2778622.1 metallophosphoesterase [Algoriphagus sp. D3-2-R+10]